MKNEFLVVSTSLNPESNSRKLALEAYKLLAEKGDAKYIDLQDYKLPFCDGDSCYSHPQVSELSTLIGQARCVLMAVPVYNFDANAAAKNLIELTGGSWNDKIVGFLCAAGGRSSYMSIMGLANSLMLDFRCLIIPRFVYAEGSSFSQKSLSDKEIIKRIGDLVDSSMALSNAVWATQQVS